MKNLLLALVALAAAPSIHAQPEFAYYGISLSNFDYTEVLPFEDVFSDSVSSYSLMVGYQFMEHLTVEGGYGKTGTIRDTNTLFTPPVSFRGDIRTLTLRLLGVLPFDNGLALMGGISYSDMEQDAEFTQGANPAVSVDRSSNEPAFYFGAQYNWERFALRLGWEKHDFGDSPFGEIAEVEETSIAFFYKL